MIRGITFTCDIDFQSWQTQQSIFETCSKHNRTIMHPLRTHTLKANKPTKINHAIINQHNKFCVHISAKLTVMKKDLIFLSQCKLRLNYGVLDLKCYHIVPLIGPLLIVYVSVLRLGRSITSLHVRGMTESEAQD